MNMKNKCHVLARTKRQNGIGLIELLLSISIIAVIVIGAIVLFKSANESTKAEDLSKGFATMSATLHALYGQQPNYGVAGADLGLTLAQSGALPNNMVSGGNVVTPYGTLTVKVNAGNVRQFDVTYALGTIPGSVCAKFIPNLIGTVRNIVVNGIQITTPALAITNCTIVDANNNTSADIVITSD